MIVSVAGMLSGTDAIHIATVLEDCVDQLAVLGRIMPASFEARSDAVEVSTHALTSNLLYLEITHVLYSASLQITYLSVYMMKHHLERTKGKRFNYNRIWKYMTLYVITGYFSAGANICIDSKIYLFIFNDFNLLNSKLALKCNHKISKKWHPEEQSFIALKIRVYRYMYLYCVGYSLNATSITSY